MSTKMDAKQKRRTKIVLTSCALFLGLFMLIMTLATPKSFSDPGVGIGGGIALVVIGLCISPVWNWMEKDKRDE